MKSCTPWHWPTTEDETMGFTEVTETRRSIRSCRSRDIAPDILEILATRDYNPALDTDGTWAIDCPDTL
jgi:hypothetical protein